MAAAYHLLDTIQIPRGMRWTDEFGTDWQPVQRASAYSLTGALILDVAQRLEGRPITLAASDDQGFMRRATLLALRALAAAVPDTTHTLTLADGRVFTVRFAPGDDCVSATPVLSAELPADWQPYVCTLKLIEVSA